MTKNIPAFPVEVIYTQENERFNGMTLRDYFASRAMQSIMIAYKHTLIADVATNAYQMADAMMKAREQ